MYMFLEIPQPACTLQTFLFIKRMPVIECCQFICQKNPHMVSALSSAFPSPKLYIESHCILFYYFYLLRFYQEIDLSLFPLIFFCLYTCYQVENVGYEYLIPLLIPFLCALSDLSWQVEGRKFSGYGQRKIIFKYLLCILFS